VDLTGAAEMLAGDRPWVDLAKCGRRSAS